MIAFIISPQVQEAINIEIAANNTGVVETIGTSFVLENTGIFVFLTLMGLALLILMKILREISEQEGASDIVGYTLEGDDEEETSENTQKPTHIKRDSDYEIDEREFD